MVTLNARKVAAGLRTSGTLVHVVDKELFDACERVLHFWIERELARVPGNASQTSEPSCAKDPVPTSSATRVSLLPFLNFGRFEVWLEQGCFPCVWSMLAGRRLVLGLRWSQEEFQEALVAASCLLAALRGLEGGVGERMGALDGGAAMRVQNQDVPPSLEVYDVCCGKGFFAMLLAYVAPTFEPFAAIQGITMLDKSDSISQMHLQVAQQDAVSGICLPIRYLQADIHDNQLARRLGLLDAVDNLDDKPLQFAFDVDWQVPAEQPSDPTPRAGPKRRKLRNVIARSEQRKGEPRPKSLGVTAELR
eukprot:scaffold603_cov404-Prasinococcus_capsulatus_cf.AAC.52